MDITIRADPSVIIALAAIIVALIAWHYISTRKG